MYMKLIIFPRWSGSFTAQPERKRSTVMPTTAAIAMTASTCQTQKLHAQCRIKHNFVESKQGKNACNKKKCKIAFVGFKYPGCPLTCIMHYLNRLSFLNHDPHLSGTAAPRWASMPSCAQTWDKHNVGVCVWYEFVTYYSKKVQRMSCVHVLVYIICISTNNISYTYILYIYMFVYTQIHIEYLYSMSSTHKLKC